MAPFAGSKALRRWRKSAGYTQKKVAEHVGVKQSSVCEWECGSRRPDYMNALRVELLSGGLVPIELWGLTRDAELAQPVTEG